MVLLLFAKESKNRIVTLVLFCSAAYARCIGALGALAETACKQARRRSTPETIRLALGISKIKRRELGHQRRQPVRLSYVLSTSYHR